MSKQLLPCPFCGFDIIGVLRTRTEEWISYSLTCQRCGIVCEAIDDTSEEHIRNCWNKRIESDKVPAWLKKAIMKRIQSIDTNHTAAYKEGLSDAYWDVLDLRPGDVE